MTARKYQTEPKHRIPFTGLTEEQIIKKLKAALNGPPCQSAFSTSLAGTSLRVKTDPAPTPEHPGPTLEYKFHNNRDMSVSINGKAAVKTGYGALELKQLLLISHLVPGTTRGCNIVIDRHTGLATVFETWFGAGFDPQYRPHNSTGGRGTDIHALFQHETDRRRRWARPEHIETDCRGARRDHRFRQRSGRNRVHGHARTEVGLRVARKRSWREKQS